MALLFDFLQYCLALRFPLWMYLVGWLVLSLGVAYSARIGGQERRQRREQEQACVALTKELSDQDWLVEAMQDTIENLEAKRAATEQGDVDPEEPSLLLPLHGPYALFVPLSSLSITNNEGSVEAARMGLLSAWIEEIEGLDSL